MRRVRPVEPSSVPPYVILGGPLLPNRPDHPNEFGPLYLGPAHRPFDPVGEVYDHLGLAPNLRKNIKLQYYEAGHMMYVHDEDLAKLKATMKMRLASSGGSISIR